MEYLGQDNFVIVPTVGGTIVSIDGHDHDHDALTNFVANKHIDHSTLTLTAGEGLSGGGTIDGNVTFNLDVNGLTADATPDGAADYIVTYDASATGHKKVLLDNLPGGGGAPDFTEAWTALGRPSSASTWQTKVVTGATANSIVQIVMYNDNNSSETLGVRAVGSGLSRSVMTVKNGTTTFTVKLDASSQMQWFSSNASTSVTFYYSGEIV